MKFSEQWLREWVNPAVTTAELAHQLTMAGLEVDAVEPVASSFSGVVVGEVLAVEPHPNADRLRFCRVDAGGDKPLEIVCGAANVAAGLKVPVATVGAHLPGNLRIAKSKLRGVTSEGMLCSAKELGLAETADGLMVLSAELVPGVDFRAALLLDDVSIELSLTPNRGDCLSVAGIAREVAAINKAALGGPAMAAVAPAIDTEFPVRVEAAAACPRYLGRVIKGVDARAATPLWMQERLRRSGVRSISALVDVTNYVLLELGQPMHAFDLGKLQGQVMVRMAEQGESLRLLDGKDIDLNADTLVIADNAGPVAVAGGKAGPLIERDSAEHLPEMKPVTLRAERLRRVLGIEVAGHEVADILRRLGMTVTEHAQAWDVLPPSFRFDIRVEADVIEEVARSYGYGNLPSTRPLARLQLQVPPEGQVTAERLRALLEDRGYQEAITYSFVEPRLQQILVPAQPTLALANPISADMAVMRTSLWPGLVQALVHNQNRQQNRVRLFEVGRRFRRSGAEWREQTVVAGVAIGSAEPEQWGTPKRRVDLFEVKADVTAVLALTGKREETFSYTSTSHAALHPGQAAQIQDDKQRTLGMIGVMHPAAVQALDINAAPVLFEVELDTLAAAHIPRFRELSKFPAFRRDLAVGVDEAVAAESLRDAIRAAAGDLLQELQLFDLYRGKGIDSEKKSLALGLTLQDSSRTLADEDVDLVV